MNFKDFIKENKKYVSVYHVSPRSDMFKLRPTGHGKGVRSLIGKGQPGLFVAPKFRDAVAWAVSYVSGKKSETQRPNERLREKGGGYHGEKGPKLYKNLTIYEIKVPKEVLVNSYYTGWWEPEYFITAENLDKMRIIKSKTYHIEELTDIYRRDSNSRITNVYPQQTSHIKKVSKTNLAARYYLELTDLYNMALMQGKKPVIASTEFSSDSEHLIRQEIDKLKKYIFGNTFSWNVQLVEKLDKKQESEAREIYERIKRMIKDL